MSKCQLLQLNLPEYLADFFITNLNTDSLDLPDGSKAFPFVVNRNSLLGKLVISELAASNIPLKVSQDPCFYVSISNYVGDHSKNVPRGNRTFYVWKDGAQERIIKLFKDFFEYALRSYVFGAQDQESIKNDLASKSRLRNGIDPEKHLVKIKDNHIQVSEDNKAPLRKKFIRTFLLTNKISHTNTQLERWYKMCKRSKERSNPLLYKLS